MITWVLFLWMGGPLPMKVEGYLTYDDCKNAGEYRSANKDHHSGGDFECIPGPVRYESLKDCK